MEKHTSLRRTNPGIRKKENYDTRQHGKWGRRTKTASQTVPRTILLCQDEKEAVGSQTSYFQRKYARHKGDAILLSRIFLPFVGITVSSRESASFRDGIVKIAATKVSAGVSTGIGDHDSKYNGKENEEPQGDEQFEINDSRSLDKMYQDIAEEGLQPVLNDYLYIG